MNIKSPDYYSGLVTIFKTDSKAIKFKKGKASSQLKEGEEYDENDLKCKNVLETEVKKSLKITRTDSKNSYTIGISLALRYDNTNKKLKCRPGFKQIGAVCQPKKSTQMVANMAIKTIGDAQLPSRKEVARLAGQLLGDFVRNPIQATKEGLERERLVREELKNRGYDLPDNTELTKQAVVAGAKKTKDYIKNNPEAVENLAVNTAGFAASKVGGALLGPLGGFGGDLLGALSVRKGLTDYKAYKAAAEKLSTDQAFQSASKLKKLAMLKDATLAELETIEFRELAQNNLASDVEGWAIGNTAAEVIGIPLSGATVVMTTTEPLLTTFREEKYQNNKSNLEAAKEAFKKTVKRPVEAIKAGNEREAKFREKVNEQLRELRDNILKSN